MNCFHWEPVHLAPHRVVSEGQICVQEGFRGASWVGACRGGNEPNWIRRRAGLQVPCRQFRAGVAFVLTLGAGFPGKCWVSSQPRWYPQVRAMPNSADGTATCRRLPSPWQRCWGTWVVQQGNQDSWLLCRGLRSPQHCPYPVSGTRWPAGREQEDLVG